MQRVAVAVVLIAFATGATAAQRGIASWYAGAFIGRHTASGVVYTGRGFTAAHRHAPLNSCLKVIYKRKSAIVKVTDRGPYVAKRVLDVSPPVAHYLGFYAAGLAKVTLHKAPCPR